MVECAVIKAYHFGTIRFSELTNSKEQIPLCKWHFDGARGLFRVGIEDFLNAWHIDTSYRSILNREYNLENNV